MKVYMKVSVCLHPLCFILPYSPQILIKHVGWMTCTKIIVMFRSSLKIILLRENRWRWSSTKSTTLPMVAMVAVGTAAGKIGSETAMGTTTGFTLKNLCLINTYIFHFKICVWLTTISLFLRREVMLWFAERTTLMALQVLYNLYHKSIVAVLIFADIQIQTLRWK